jgi:hypothetical protein
MHQYAFWVYLALRSIATRNKVRSESRCALIVFKRMSTSVDTDTYRSLSAKRISERTIELLIPYNINRAVFITEK